jgi:glycosyltransferase involved in cell wall biosynthesis
MLDVLRKLIIEKHLNIQINFVGINSLENQEKKIKERYSDILVNLSFYDRMPASNLQQIYNHSDLLWLTSFDNMKGWYPVKLFDYAKQGIPILLYPTDNDVMQNFIETGSVGKAFDNESDISIFLKGILESKNTFSFNPNTKVLNEFTREYQTKQLSEKIHEICKYS